MDLIGLNELARTKRLSRGRLLRQIRAVERELKIKLIVQSSPGAKVWVARDVLHVLADRVHKHLSNRVTRVENTLRSHKARIEELETKL